MTENFEHTIEVLRRGERSKEDLDFLYSQLILLSDLRQYIFDLSPAKKQLLLSAFQLETYPEGHLVFHKGDPSDKLYLILAGKLDMYDEEGIACVHIATLSQGKMIGERGLVRRTERMLSAKTNSSCCLLTLDQENFRNLLEDAIYQRMEEKLKFIDRYVPCARVMASALKERLAYAFNMQYFHRGQPLLTRGETSDVIHFVFYGECTVTETDNHHTKNVVKLSPGSWTGEDCVLFSIPSPYDVFISSEFAWLYSLSKDNALKLLTDSSIEIMKQQSVLKRKNRAKLANKVLVLKPAPIKLDNSEEQFHLASPIAKRMLIKTSASLGQMRRTLLLREERSGAIREELNEKREIGPISVRYSSPRSEDSTPRQYTEYPWALWKLKQMVQADRMPTRRYAL